MPAHSFDLPIYPLCTIVEESYKQWIILTISFTVYTKCVGYSDKHKAEFANEKTLPVRNARGVSIH